MRNREWLKDPLLAGWLRLFERALTDGRVLEIPSAPFLFNLKGLKSVDLQGAPSITWMWRRFRVDVNGGGLLAEGALSPSDGLVTEFEHLDTAELGLGLAKQLGLEDSEETYFNPLAWRPRAPILLPEGAPALGVCLETSWGSVSLGVNADPISFVSTSSCIKAHGFREDVEVSIAGFKTVLKGESLQTSGLKVVNSSDFVAGISGSVLRLFSKQGTVEFSSQYFNPRLSVLYPFIYYPMTNSKSVRANSVVVEAFNSSLAIASSKPVEVELRPGGLIVHFRSDLLIARAREHQALSLLVESMVSWKPISALGGGTLFHPRTSKALAYLIATDAPHVMLVAYCMSDEGGVLELRLHKKLENAHLIDPLASEVIPLKTFDSLLRIPLLMPYTHVSLKLDVSNRSLRKGR